MDKGYKVRILREQHNFSQKEVAMELGITQSAYCKMEACEHKISIDNCVRIAKVIGVSVADIIDFDDKYHFVGKEQLNEYETLRKEREELKREVDALRADNRILLKLVEKLHA
jgi:transcriptional regulator with XRE-family HTH domain